MAFESVQSQFEGCSPEEVKAMDEEMEKFHTRMRTLGPHMVDRTELLSRIKQVKAEARARMIAEKSA